MADITLHSGSFCDRNNNEISITFFKKETTPQMTVEPTSLSYIAAGETKTLRVSGYTGTLSISVPVGWLSYTQSTSSGVRTYTLTATANTSTSVRSATITLTDSYNTVTVGVAQAGTDAFTVSPTSFQYGGTGSTNTFTFTGVPAGGISYEIPSGVDWVTVSNLSNASVDITTSANNNPTSRTTTVKFYDMDDMDNYVTVTVNQEAGQESLSVVPSSITYLPEGGTYGITATWTAGNEPTATVTYVQGEGGWMTPTGSGTVTGNTKEWAWTASANNTGSSRTALITVTNGLQSEYVTVSQSSASAALYVTPSSLSFVSTGETKTATVSNISGALVTNAPSWITVADSGEGSSRLVNLTAASNTLSTSRSDYVGFADSRSDWVYIDVEQAGTVPATISVDKSVINFTANVGTDTVTVTYSGQGYVSASGGTSWLDVTYKDQPTPTTVRFDIIIDQNTGSSRSATITFTGSLGGTATTTVNQAAAAVPWSVNPAVIENINYLGDTVTLTFAGTPSIGMRYEVTPSTASWVGVTLNSLSQATVTIGANSGSSRTATIKFYKMDDSSVYLSVPVSQNGSSVAALSVMDVSMSFIAAGERKQTTVENIVGTLTTTKPSWITLAMSGEGGSRLVSVTAASNTLSTSRGGSVIFDDDRQSPVSMAVSQEGASPYTVTPSATLHWGYDYVDRSDSAPHNIIITGLSSRMTTPNGVITYGGEEGAPSDWLTIGNGSIGSTTYTTSLRLTRKADRVKMGTWTATIDWYSGNIYLGTTNVVRDGTLPNSTVTPSTVTYTTLSASLPVEVMTPYVPITTSTTENWFSISSGTSQHPSNDPPLYYYTVTAARNTGTYRSGTAIFTGYSSSSQPVVSIGEVAVKQRGVMLSVTPMSLEYTSESETQTLTVSRINANGFDYTTTADWLSGTKTAYELILTAASNLSTSTRATSVRIYDIYDTTNRVDIPITQASHIEVPTLTASPTSIAASTSLSTYTETITYPSEYGISGSVNYVNGSNWITLDYQPVTGNTRTVNVIIEGNNSGSGRAAQILFTGDAGGTATVDVYQPSN